MENNKSWYEGADGELRVLISQKSGCGRFITLRHPKSGNSTSYVFNDEALQELHWFKQPYGSWFLGDYVLQDGGMYFLTSVDLVFLLLPLLEEARMKRGIDSPGNFRPLEDILFVQDYPDYHLLLPLAERFLLVVCDVKESGSSRFFRLDDDKVLSWMVCKANQLKAVLPNLGAHYAERDERDTLADAVLIMGEYLQESWLKALCVRLKLSFEELFSAQPVETSDGNAEGIASNSFQANTVSEKKNNKPVKQAKKPKIETKSQNIGDMFRRVTRRG